MSQLRPQRTLVGVDGHVLLDLDVGQKDNMSREGNASG